MKIRNLLVTSGLIFTGAEVVNAQVIAPTGWTPYLFVCQSCPAGTYSDGTLEECRKCSKGTYSTGNAKACTLCKAGTYQDKEGQSECKLCPAGSYCLQGAESSTKCPAGKYQSGTGQSSCNSCPAGYYCPVGSTEYTICPAGYYCPAGAGAYTSCSSNQSRPSASKNCGDETVYWNTYCDGTGNSYNKATSHSYTYSHGSNYSNGQYCNNGIITNCTNKPSGSHYTTKGSCSWTCDNGYKQEGNNCSVMKSCEGFAAPSGCGSSCPSVSPSTYGAETKADCLKHKYAHEGGGSGSYLKWGGSIIWQK